MKYIGAHISSSGGLSNVVIRAFDIGATAFAFFTKNPRQWKSPVISDSVVIDFKAVCKKYNYSSEQILPHGSYLINLCHPEENMLTKSRELLIKEIKFCQKLGLKFLNVHPGNSLIKFREIKDALFCTSESINIALEKTENVKIIIENTAGQGSAVGFKFEHLASIIENVKDKTRIGVCVDTCHTFSAGYDIRTLQACEDVFSKFKEIIGFEYLHGVHLNDTQSTLNSRIDRHYNIGKGNIGKNIFRYIMLDNRFNNIPLILETPNSSFWKNEILWLKNQQKEDIEFE